SARAESGSHESQQCRSVIRALNLAASPYDQLRGPSMNNKARIVALALSACLIASCSEPKARVTGSMRFILGGTSGSVVPGPAMRSAGSGPALAALVPNDEYIVSPRKAKITFTSVQFTTATGDGSGASTLGDCTVTYGRSLSSGSTILDCPFAAPVGEI